jgi:hypothetical protein
MALAEASRRDGKTFDAETELKALAAVTTTGVATGIAFPVRKDKEYKAVIYVTAFDCTTEDETYAINVQVSDLVGGTYTAVGQTLTVVATGEYEIPLSGAACEQIDADSAFIQVAHTLAGTTPSITYGAYLSPA